MPDSADTAAAPVPAPADVIDGLLAHRSIRRYRDEPIPDAVLERCVRAGQAASTSSAVQATTVIDVQDAETRRRLAELSGGQSQVETAARFLVVCGDQRRHRLAARRHGTTYDTRLEGFLVAAIDAALFAQNLCVALESLGYGICYIGGLRNDLAAVDALLELPEGVLPMFGLCAGVPDEAPSARPRLPLEAVLFRDRYPDDEAVLARLDAYDATYRAYLADRGAPARAWTERMVELHAAPRRAYLAAFYAAKGARLD
jgi:FMN reductase (NADPH)